MEFLSLSLLFDTLSPQLFSIYPYVQIYHVLRLFVVDRWWTFPLLSHHDIIEVFFGSRSISITFEVFLYLIKSLIDYFFLFAIWSLTAFRIFSYSSSVTVSSSSRVNPVTHMTWISSALIWFVIGRSMFGVSPVWFVPTVTHSSRACLYSLATLWVRVLSVISFWMLSINISGANYMIKYTYYA